MDYAITYYSEAVQEQIMDLPDTLAARYIVLTRRMVALGVAGGVKALKSGGILSSRTDCAKCCLAVYLTGNLPR